MTSTSQIDTSTAKPIAFAPAMVEAIRAGRKTVTRRPVKPQPDAATQGFAQCDDPQWWMTHSVPAGYIRQPDNLDLREEFSCPYGAAEQLLYVKERWRYEMVEAGSGYHVGLRYQSDGLWVNAATAEIGHDILDKIPAGKLLTPWHVQLPKWAARTFLRVENIRVERVQAISEGDVKEEGFSCWTKDGQLYKWAPLKIHRPAGERDPAWPWVDMPRSATEAYARLWDSHKRADAYTWAANPWVWVISFAPLPRSESTQIRVGGLGDETDPHDGAGRPVASVAGRDRADRGAAADAGAAGLPGALGATEVPGDPGSGREPRRRAAVSKPARSRS